MTKQQQLALTFLGEFSPKSIPTPGCTSRARWMQKAIYSLKMFMYRKEPNAEIKDITLLGDICLFLVFVYIPYWYDFTTASHSLFNDILLIKNKKLFSNINKRIAESALDKFTKQHLWYMGYHLSALGFFDERISVIDKRKMLGELHQEKKRQQKVKEGTNIQIQHHYK